MTFRKSRRSTEKRNRNRTKTCGKNSPYRVTQVWKMVSPKIEYFWVRGSTSMRGGWHPPPVWGKLLSGSFKFEKTHLNFLLEIYFLELRSSSCSGFVVLTHLCALQNRVWHVKRSTKKIVFWERNENIKSMVCPLYSFKITGTRISPKFEDRKTRF